MDAARTAYSSDLPGKRIILACDGTWLDADNGLDKGQLPIPSNVTRILRALKVESADGIPQVAHYEAGVGSQGGPLTRAVGGATAEGISTNIRAGYDFISQNYVPGDEIFLVGFSRGAFTARSVAGLIDNVGVLTRAGLPYLDVIFKDFENRADPDYASSYPNVPFPNKPSSSNPQYRKELQRRKLSLLNVPIKAVAVWETVGTLPSSPPHEHDDRKLKPPAGSLGIPRVPWLEGLGLQSRAMKEYRFFDTSLSNCIENAFQALALDERRAAFVPAVWEKSRSNKTVRTTPSHPPFTAAAELLNPFFLHFPTGGGYEDQELANITLAWMIAQLEPLLDFDADYIRAQYKDTRTYYLQSGQDVRPWSFGEIYPSSSGLYALGGRTTRTPGTYTRLSPLSGRPTATPLRNTHEYIHASARARTALRGPGVDDHGVYDSAALADYTLRVASPRVPGEPLAVWESRARRRGGAPRKVLVESPLWETERRLLGYSPEVEGGVLGGREGREGRGGGDGRERG
ncbi:hypothetical protein MMC27_006191 [Xylographa pallens]|nr:hypothetical protein [Xylographa pallens]